MSKNSGNSIVWKKIQEIDHCATGAAMRAKREASRKTLREVSAKMGISSAYLGDLERGFRNWTVAKVMAFERGIK